MRPGQVVTRQIRQQVHAVEFPLRRNLTASRGQECRQEVELDHRMVVDFAGREPSVPPHHERHADAPFPRLGLEAAERSVARRRLLRRSAVVGEIDHQRAVVLADLLERGQHAADGVVLRRHHRREHPPVVVGDMRKAVDVVLRRLERVVLGVERQVEEERFFAVRLEPLAGPVGIGLGGVEAVVGDGHGLGGHSRVDDRGVKKRRVAPGAQELVESPAGGDELVGFPQMPLADGTGGVAQRPEPAGYRGFGDRQAKLRSAAVPLVAKPRLVAASHQAGSRGAAVRARDVSLRESNARRGDGVDVRRRDLRIALAAEFAVALIVGEEDDEVWLATCLGSPCGLPGGKGEGDSRDRYEHPHGITSATELTWRNAHFFHPSPDYSKPASRRCPPLPHLP